MDLRGADGRDCIISESRFCAGAGGIFSGISDSVFDLLDPFSYAGDWRRGYKIIFCNWLPEWR